MLFDSSSSCGCWSPGAQHGRADAGSHRQVQPVSLQNSRGEARISATEPQPAVAAGDALRAVEPKSKTGGRAPLALTDPGRGGQEHGMVAGGTRQPLVTQCDRLESCVDGGPAADGDGLPAPGSEALG